jgi:hypothetical protein
MDTTSPRPPNSADRPRPSSSGRPQSSADSPHAPASKPISIPSVQPLS